jgi:hypothetical protein
VLQVSPAPQDGDDADRRGVAPVNDQIRIEWEETNRHIGEVRSRVPLPRHPSKRLKQGMELSVEAISQINAVGGDVAQISRRSVRASAEIS